MNEATVADQLETLVQYYSRVCVCVCVCTSCVWAENNGRKRVLEIACVHLCVIYTENEKPALNNNIPFIFYYKWSNPQFHHPNLPA